jgi:hypothetical protein
MRTVTRKAASRGVSEEEKRAAHRRFDKLFNHQRKIATDAFMRHLGRVPCVRNPANTIHLDIGEVAETFGPPEVQMLKAKKRLFWNFRNHDDVGRFSTWADVPISGVITNVRMNVSTSYRNFSRAHVDFYTWVSDRIGSVSNNDENPAVTNGAGFVIVPAEHLAHS